MNTKICIDCNQEKPLEQFNKQAKSKDKHGSYCKDCANARALKWRLDNIEHRAEYRKIYNKENAEVVRERTQDWRDRNRPRVRQLGKEFYEANPERNLCYDAKKRAKRFDVPFSITHEDIVSILKFLRHSQTQRDLRPSISLDDQSRLIRGHALTLARSIARRCLLTTALPPTDLALGYPVRGLGRSRTGR